MNVKMFKDPDTFQSSLGSFHLSYIFSEQFWPKVLPAILSEAEVRI